jgi:type IV secretory pathway protease TraF
MVPAYRPGDFVIGWRWFRIGVGQVVVVSHRGLPILKRVKKKNEHQVWLQGDNPDHSTDSRHYGPVELEKVVARAIFKF